jgi:hypothetical protein
MTFFSILPIATQSPGERGAIHPLSRAGVVFWQIFIKNFLKIHKKGDDYENEKNVSIGTAVCHCPRFN